MADLNWNDVEAIIDEALALPEDQRQDFIDSTCGDNVALKSEVTLLLQSISDSEGWLDNPGEYKEQFYKDAFDDPESTSVGSSLLETHVGPYQIKELLGEGGMGLVYRAERTDGAFEHQVALKVLREGMDTEHNILRFRQERNILAGLNHPNIAGILDGGVTENGLPYLIMEYVEGLPIDEYCNRHKCTINERIELFKSICNAVQHAHNNLIIHRDLKPANILVNANGHVKILDFGIAKLLQHDNPEMSWLQTRTGARILTLSYAAPEQVSGQPVTTGVDNYALGTLLYKLLTGVHPFDKEGKSTAEMEELITEVTPLKSSERFDKLPDVQKKELSHQLKSAPARIVHALKGDLDAIILKNLRKEPKSRYNSPNQLLEDLERFEKGLAVTAQEDTIRYHTTKFIKRHRTILLSLAAAVLIILGFGIFYTYQITQERDRAQLETEKAEQVSSLLIDLFSASDPALSLGDTLSVRFVLEQGQKKINQLSHQPEIKSKMLNTVGKVYTNLGQYKKAEELLMESLNIQKNNSGSPIEIADIHTDLGVLYHKASDLSLAELHYRHALELRSKNLDTDHPAYAQSLSDLGVLMRTKGNIDSAEYYSKMAYEIRQRIPDGNRLDIATSLNNLAVLENNKGNLDKAEELYLNALSIRKKELGSIHPKIANTLNNIGVLLRTKGEFERAEKYYKKSLDMRLMLLGQNHPKTAQSLNNFANLLLEKGDLDKAILYYQQALDIRKKIFEANDIKIGNSHNNLANALLKTGQLDDAVKAYREAIKIYASTLGNKHRYVGIVQSNLGRVLTAKGEFNKAGNSFSSAQRILQQSYESDHISIANLYGYMSELEIQRANLKSAVKHLENALEIRQKLLGDSHPDIKENVNKLTGLRQRLASD